MPMPRCSVAPGVKAIEEVLGAKLAVFVFEEKLATLLKLNPVQGTASAAGDAIFLVPAVVPFWPLLLPPSAPVLPLLRLPPLLLPLLPLMPLLFLLLHPSGESLK